MLFTTVSLGTWTYVGRGNPIDVNHKKHADDGGHGGKQDDVDHYCARYSMTGMSLRLPGTRVPGTIKLSMRNLGLTLISRDSLTARSGAGCCRREVASVGETYPLGISG